MTAFALNITGFVLSMAVFVLKLLDLSVMYWTGLDWT